MFDRYCGRYSGRRWQDFYLRRKAKRKTYSFFNLNGKFITSIGRKGQGAGGYNRIFSFDVDLEERSIITVTCMLRSCYFMILDSYQFKYTINTKFYYNAFLHLPYGEKIFMGYKGFENQTDQKDKDSYYIYTTDSLLNPQKLFIKRISKLHIL